MKEKEEPESKMAGNPYSPIVNRTHGLTPATLTEEI
jgi:hypothetical protein